MTKFCTQLIVVAVFCSFSLIFPVSAQVATQSLPKVPRIKEVSPSRISPGICIRVSGYYLGDISENKYFFSQGTNEIEAKAEGADWNGDDWANAFLHHIVEVPRELTPGNWEVVVESEGLRSLPFAVTVSPIREPAKISAVHPPFVKPGESIAIDGIGFAEDDHVTFVDSVGKTYSHKISGLFSDGSASVKVPDGLTTGTVRLSVVETQSGMSQSSNFLTLEVRRGPTPLALSRESLLPVSPGQWIHPVYWTSDSMIHATKLEFLVTQNDDEETTFITDFKKIKLQIPDRFNPGNAQIQTRLWIKDESSEWSKPIDFEIASSPRNPVVERFEVIPAKAEAKFVLNEKVLRVLPIYLGVLPSVQMPADLKDGRLRIYTRYLSRGNFSAWKLTAEYDSFDPKEHVDHNFHPEYREKPSKFTFNPFIRRDQKPDVFEVKKGEIIRIAGNFFVDSIEDLEVIIENSNESYSISPKRQEFDTLIACEIPFSIRSGNWKIFVRNRKSGVQSVPGKILLIR